VVDLSVEEPAVEDVLLCELEVDVLPLQAQLLAEGPETVRESDAMQTTMDRRLMSPSKVKYGMTAQGVRMRRITRT